MQESKISPKRWRLLKIIEKTKIKREKNKISCDYNNYLDWVYEDRGEGEAAGEEKNGRKRESTLIRYYIEKREKEAAGEGYFFIVS